MRFVLFLSVILICASCASRIYKIHDQNLSLGELKKVILSVIGEPRILSENQRTFHSRYFSRNSDAKFDPERSKERLYAKVSILGDRRPYDLEIEIIVEERSGKTYAEVGSDEIEARKLGKDIRDRLHQGRDDRNVIDDFRAF